MKHSTLLTVFILLATAVARAEVDVQKDFDTLGANEAIVKRAKALDPKNRVRIVQNRVVDRYNRLELGVNYGYVGAGGDAYVDTSNLGGSLDWHFTPRWSLGGRYYTSFNSLSPEGREAMEEARRIPNNTRPQIDHARETGLAVLNWYPIYGKTNLFDMTVAQFDFYLLGGYGKMKLTSGWTDTATAGGGMGIWLTQHIASRLELRWQTYEDQLYTGPRRLNTAVATASIGFML